MTKKTSKRNKIEYEPFNTESALSVEGINLMQMSFSQMQGHNTRLQEQNRALQRDLNITQKALELSITAFWIEQVLKEPTDTQMKEDITDYKQQAVSELKRQDET